MSTSVKCPQGNNFDCTVGIYHKVTIMNGSRDHLVTRFPKLFLFCQRKKAQRYTSVYSRQLSDGSQALILENVFTFLLHPEPGILYCCNMTSSQLIMYCVIWSMAEMLVSAYGHPEEYCKNLSGLS